MELILERDLEHQQKAVQAISDVFKGANIVASSIAYQNPIFSCDDISIKNNILLLQKKNKCKPSINAAQSDESFLNIDVKMETGTGKTYVYTQSIFELHKNYGFNKFIIAVPSLSIKAGTKQFIEDPYVRQHFSDVCGYNCEIELGVLESIKTNKKSFLVMPAPIRDYVSGSSQNSNRIYVLLLNMQLLTNGKMLSRSDYDYLVEDFYRPFDALRATKPVVIIDEPHRFSRDQQAYKKIVDELKPQLMIRFGATFPQLSVGKGKKKQLCKDYDNLIYELNACDSFNQNLIKGVAKEHFEPISDKQEKVKILSVINKTSVTFQLNKQGHSPKSFPLSAGDSLSIIDPAFDGIYINAIDKKKVLLSNGQVKQEGEVLNTDIYTSSYQEQMVKLALQRHFETERQNFSGRQYKIKTLALFFIDDITSYRNSEDGKTPYLKEAFEKLLKEKMQELIDSLPEEEQQYREYLKASLSNIPACHAGYFARDNDDSDEEVAKEVDDILRNKKQLLSFYNEDGTYNVRRFLFSKWTLKEGWDNPNVFTIAKLRSSGSETSLLQEVGRGLRLPVDENGNRISNEEFLLNYIVDFEEADFAQRLVNEINGDVSIETSKIDNDSLEYVASVRGLDPSALLIDLLTKKYVDVEHNIVNENRDVFFTEYPEFVSGVKSGKVIDRNKTKTDKVKIRKAAYNELKELWEAINQKYYLYYDKELENELPDALYAILTESDTFSQRAISSHREKISINSNGKARLDEEAGVSYMVNHAMPYNDFLKAINIQTCIPIRILHNAITKLSDSVTISPELFNEYSVAQIVSKFRDWKVTNTQTRFHYKKSNQHVTETALSYKDGEPREVLKQGVVGTMIASGSPSSKYLYDTIAFDSPLEKENIMTDIDEVVVYGKIPRSSISIPTIIGENYSPDFMYVVKRLDGTKELNIIVETKLVENQTSLRGKELSKIKCAEEFFKQLSLDGYKVSFHAQLSNRKVKQIVEEVMRKST